MDTLAHEYGWSIPTIMDMTREQVFSCLDAIGNRYGREASAYEKNKTKQDGTVDFDDALHNNPEQLQAMGINVIKQQ